MSQVGHEQAISDFHNSIVNLKFISNNKSSDENMNQL